MSGEFVRTIIIKTNKVLVDNGYPQRLSMHMGEDNYHCNL